MTLFEITDYNFCDSGLNKLDRTLSLFDALIVLGRTIFCKSIGIKTLIMFPNRQGEFMKVIEGTARTIS